MRSLYRGLLGITVAMGLGVSTLAGAMAETTIRFVPGSDLQVLDPIWTTSGVTKYHGYMIYDTLFSMDGNGVAQPQMVDSYKLSNDKLTYTFTLRDGLKWHDGKPVTAEDCVASIKRWGAKDGAGKVLMSRTKELRVVNDKTFVLELSKPYGVVIDSLGKNISNIPFMMPKRVAATSPDEQIKETIGSGPFVFVKDEWVPGSKVVYKKFDGYVPRKEPASGVAGGKVAKVDRVEWVIVGDPQTALSAIVAGEVDYWDNPISDVLPVLESSKGVTTKIISQAGWLGMQFINHRHPPFNDVRARQALAWLMNQETYLQAIIGNPALYKTCPSFFACGMPMSTDVGSEAIMGHDPKKAKALFKATGWNFKTPIVLLDPTDDAIVHAATLVTAQALRNIGLTVDIQAMDWATLSKRRAMKETPSEGGWNLFISYGGGVTLSNPLFSTAYSATGDYYNGVTDATIEKLRTDWALAVSLEEKQEVARKYQKRAFEIGLWLPYGQWAAPVALRDNLHGVLDNTEAVVFWNIEKR